MFSVKTLIVAALLSELVLVVDTSVGEGASSYNFDLSNASDLNRLYNSPVYQARRMRRPMGSLSFRVGPISHSGVRVTLRDGSTWLVHKGNNFGASSQTVVVDARHMSSAWEVGSHRSYNLDLTKASDLTMLYNSPVYLAFRMERPLGDHHFYIGPFGHIAGQLSHSGVKVNLADGSEWLVHKGKEFGSGSQTVVVDARHMSPYWKVFETHDFKGTKTVGDFVKTGGNDYHLLFDNCHQAAGDGYGDSSQTVVVDAKHISSDWKVSNNQLFIQG
ncbi:hypothetical protein N1851_009603 [Merluccius polli]|uniref:Uncharacterized protein n=1 Tax=Merluccius polli TaxID=89951 RepID=A0AA47N0V8_MERPO|nr:hypothetical protein N1851_009603 [Merluccius polli]